MQVAKVLLALGVDLEGPEALQASDDGRLRAAGNDEGQPVRQAVELQANQLSDAVVAAFICGLVQCVHHNDQLMFAPDQPMEGLG